MATSQDLHENVSNVWDDPHHNLMLYPVVDKISDFLHNPRDLKTNRLVCSTFDYIVKTKLRFSPVLTDVTRTSVLKSDSQLHVVELKAKDLYMVLPEDDNGELDCEFKKSGVRTLTFFEGVSAKNKQMLLSAFPRLESLSFCSCSSFVVPDKTFECLVKLKIEADSTGETISLAEFLSTATFPVLREVNLQLFFRRDIVVYYEAHHFIANHAKSLKKVTLAFLSKDDYFPPEYLTEFVIMYTGLVLKQYQDVLAGFNILDLEDLSMTFIPFEGTSLFYLGFALLESQHKLKHLKLRKQYTHSREELLPLDIVLLENSASLESVSIPHPYTFDCTWLNHATRLRSLNIGTTPEESLQMMFSDSSVYTVTALPAASLEYFRCSVKLTRDQVQWIIQECQLWEFQFYGHQLDYYGLDDVLHILRHQSKMRKLTFNCNMSRTDFNLVKDYCDVTSGLKCTTAVFGEEEFFVALGNSRAKFVISIDVDLYHRVSTLV